jgi:serine/threonine protein kinase
MPVPSSTEELLELIRKSELIPAPRLDAFMAQVTESSAASSPRDLAGLLIAAGLITCFQAEQFLQGKWRGFTIGKYRVLERVGSGGMGTVYLCEHLVVGRKVAVKVLPTSQAHNPSALGRFYREARAAGVLDHPNLVKAHDIDQDGALHFLVMDYVDGSSLQAIVARFGPMSVSRAAHCIRQAAQGLQHAHQCGLLHRDVKPANILLERNGTIRLLDLGLARFLHDNTDPLTLKYDDRNVLGTADYVSPEQALNSHEVDIRTDIYSLGATFYFLLTGQPPFPDGKISQKLIWHQVRQPVSVQQLRKDVPDDLAAVLDKMMAKKPARRYQTPLEVIDALKPWTAEPMPLPRDEEMPRLSPAVTSGPAPVRRDPAPTPTSHRSTPPPVSLPARQPRGGLVHVATLDRTPAPREQSTPPVLSTAPTVTDGPKARPAAALALSQFLEAAKKGLAVPHSKARTALLVAGLALFSALSGMLLTWSFTGR